LDPSIFQGQHERSYSTDALTSDDAKKVQNKKALSYHETNSDYFFPEVKRTKGLWQVP
jgi:hypothetical protein